MNMEGYSVGHIFADLGAKFNGAGFNKFDRAMRGAEASARRGERHIKGTTKAVAAQEKAMGRGAGAAGKMGKSTSMLGGSLKGLAVGAGAFAVFNGLKGAVQETENLARATTKLSAIVKMDTKTASEWVVVAKQRGLESKQLNQAFITLSKNVEAANAGGKKQIQMFKDLGVSQEALKSGDANRVLLEAADGFKKLGPGTKRAALAQQLFARGGQLLIGVMSKGGDAMQEQLDKVDELGASMDQNGVDNAMKLVTAQRELSTAMLGVKMQIAGALMPYLKKGAEAISGFVAQMKNPKSDAGQLKQAFLEMLPALGEMAKAMMEMGKVILPVLAPMLKLLAQAIRSIMVEFSKLPTPLKQGIVGLLAVVMVATKFASVAIAIEKIVAAGKMLAAFFRFLPISMGPVGWILMGIAVAAFLIIKNWKHIGPFFKKVGHAIVGALGKAWDWVKSAFRNVVQFVVKMAKYGFLGPIPAIIANWKAISNFLTSLPGKIWRFFKSLPGKIGGAFKAMGSNIYNSFKSLINSILGFFRGLPGRIGNILKNAGKSVWNNTVGRLPGVPKLRATGGLISGPEVALIGEDGPEVIIPVSGKYAARGKQLLGVAANALGVRAFAKGGVVGLRGRADELDRQRRSVASRYDLRSREAQLDGVITPAERAELIGLKGREEKIAGTLSTTLSALIKAYRSDIRKTAQTAMNTKDPKRRKAALKQKAKLEEGLKKAREQLSEVRGSRQDANLDRRAMEFEQDQAKNDALAETPFDALIRNLQRMLGINSRDGSVSADEKARRAAELQSRLRQAAQERLDLLTKRWQNETDQATKDAIGSALDDAASFLDQIGGGGGADVPSMAQQVISFNQSRLDLFSQFGSNFQRTSANPRSGKTITINQTYQREPQNAHAWTQQIEHFLSVA